MTETAEAAPAVVVTEAAKQQAEEFKAEANKAFQEHHLAKSVDLYTKAIELDPTNAVYYANRAFAYIKLESYGAAVLDGTKAIELNPAYIKGYYRRGSAYMALNKVKEGLKDFRKLAKLAPRDPDTQRKLKECEKAVQQLRFEEAIASEAGPAVVIADTIHLETMEVEASYSGPRMASDDDLTLTFVEAMLEEFKLQRKIHRRYAYAIILKTKTLLKSEPSLLEVPVPAGKHFTVCGDVHGQFYDLMNIFSLNGLPSEDNPYLFNGDFVDRGSFSLEVILALFAFKCLYPKGLYLTRGNHESKNMNKIYGFEGEVRAKYSDTMASLFSEVFQCLPLAAVLNGKVFVVHGGLFSEDNVTLDQIRAIDRFCEPPDAGIMCEALWSDPAPMLGRSPSKRGVGVAFGPDVTNNFLKTNNLELVVRSHEVKEEGYEVEHGGKCITVFSAPNYCDQMGNKGAFIRFESDMKPVFEQFSAVPHPEVRPMAYASPLMNFM
eukprot:jgi/Mesvir1/15861/Mv03407-RA.1